MATGSRPTRLAEVRWRSHRERRAAQHWAALSRERLVRRQAEQLQELQAVVDAPLEALRRLALVAPAPEARLPGAALEGPRILQRNVGCHARSLPRPGAPQGWT